MQHQMQFNSSTAAATAAAATRFAFEESFIKPLTFRIEHVQMDDFHSAVSCECVELISNQ